MAQLKVPDSPKIYNTHYNNLRGVDWSHSMTEIDRQHAADILNMVPDEEEGIPVKRTGWRVDKTFTGGRIIALYHDQYENLDIVATNSALWYSTTIGVYKWLKSFNNAADDVIIMHYDGRIYVIGWGEYFALDYENGVLKYSDVTPKIPLTVISRLPDGTGGTDYESVNVLSDKRMISFWTKDNATTTYKLYPANDHTITAINKVEIMGTTGWRETTEYSVGADNQSITLNSAQPAVVSGQDNVRVTFTETSDSLTALRAKIKGATVGIIDSDRMFIVADNNKLYYSDADDMTFFPDDNYIIVGHDAPIMGLHRKSGCIVAITGDSSEHSIFLIQKDSFADNKTVYNSDGTTSVQSDTIVTYSVRSSVSGTGAIATKSFSTLIDDPLFLGATGIYGITTTALNTEAIISNRSAYINPRLTKEDNLNRAVSTVYRGLYVLSVNGKCYVLDSKNTYRDSARNVCYEGYYWDLQLETGEYVTTMIAYGKTLLYGTSTGRICRFNTDIKGQTAYCDNGTLVDAHVEGGKAIVARYELLLDDDGYPQYYKNMQKKGCVITLKPYILSRVYAYYVKDGGGKTLIGSFDSGRLDWQYIDFSRFTFQTSGNVYDKYPMKKVKKYRRLQLIFENVDINQPFGLIEFVKSWTMGNFAKGK